MSTKADTQLQARGIERVIVPQWVREGAGVLLQRSIATRELDYVDPFLLFDHFGSENPDDYLAGFPMHPHRGIETVTYMLEGVVAHRDSIGNAGTIGGGDVQWMTAGRGILHEEMPKPRQGKMAGFQLWVNLPAQLKMTRPRYQEIASSQIPEVSLASGGTVRVIAGEYHGVVGAVTDIYADPTYLDVRLAPDTAFRHPIARGHSAFAYLFEGQSQFDAKGDWLGAPRLITFEDGDYVEIQTHDRGARFLLVSGKPLHEPIARYGPFVMNTRQEIQQTLKELREGTFPPDPE